MHFQTIPERSGNSYRLEAEFFTVLRSLVYNISNLASFRKFCDQVIRYIPPVGSNLWLRINPIFSSLYHNHSKFKASLTYNQKIKYRNRYLPQSFMPSVPCILPKMPLPPNLHCIAETYFLEEPKNFLIKLKKLSFKLAP